MKNTTTANKITILRIALVSVFLLLSYTDRRALCFVIYVIACLSDMLDGYIARHYNQITVFGKFMDPLADKILVITAMCVFIEWGIMPSWIVALVAFREFAVSGLRLIAAQKNIVIAAAKSGKIKTACTMVSIAAMLLFYYSNWICTAGNILIAVTTVYSGAEYFINNYNVFNDKT